MAAVLAVDAGGTSTRAVLVDVDGHCLGFGRAGGGNPISSGTERAASAIVTAAHAATDRAGLTASDVGPAILAMAGSGVNPDAAWIRDALAAAGFAGHVELRSDLLATFFAGTFEPDGYALVAGTGAAGIRVRNGVVDLTADGLGWLIGDVGSGFWIGHRVVRDAVAALDGRAAPTALTSLLLDALAIRASTALSADGRPVAVNQVTDAVYRLRPVELARFAPLAFAAPGDETARAILADAAEALARLFGAVASPELTGPLVLGGSILAQDSMVADAVTAAAAASGLVSHTQPVEDGVVGAAVLALRSAGIAVDVVIFERITRSLAALR
ncbi:BadF/BadG/BcrA/BcrD ATPase family protein [Mycetocola sp. 2940]|uniref:N-acetylglucosamine kinase n=1 Tax=Mycetocola sp. 2940 TaxID=3156452 RepID=UPI003392E399